MLSDIGPGKYEAFVLQLNGTNSSALAETDFGRFRMTEQGRDFVSVEGQNLRRINSIHGGNARQNFAAGVTDWICAIPRGYFDNNVHQILPSDRVQLALSFVGNWAARVTTANWKVYGLRRQTGVMRYNYRLVQQDISLSASQVATIPLSDENVCGIYFLRDVASGTASEIGNVTIRQDGELAATVVRFEDLNDMSDLFNQTDSLAAATSEGIANGNARMSLVQLADPGHVGEFLSDSVSIDLSTEGSFASPLKIVVASADFAPTKARQSRLDSSTVIQRKIARKNELGRTRPIQTLREEA